ncbi:MAG: L-threonylcarbamoyladenylate synthase [Alphaproteobacteria bacterium]
MSTRPYPHPPPPPGTIAAPTPEALALAGRLIGEGRLVAFPTETVYGLGADATSERAVAAVFAAKDRPSFNPLIVHVADAAAAWALVEAGALARTLGARFWPGPLTLVCRRREDCPIALLASAGLDSIAIRIPDHPVALALLRQAGTPIAAPSANRSGAVSPTTAAHVAESLGERVALILDGGPCRVGLESTVIDTTGGVPVLLRPGGLPAEEIEAVTGPLRPAGEGGSPRSPGMLARHYAPDRPLRVNVTGPRPGEILLGFGAVEGETLNLSPGGDLVEAAANLFAMLRALDRPETAAIAVSPIPESGLGRAINDRLRRAARGSEALSSHSSPPGDRTP